jgi:crotonobetainyl-CoA:carnitine CoA-transferase CaiB-like acyl-CoA transferase
MYGVDLYGDAAASMPVSVLANPVHFSRTSIVYDRPPPALGAHTVEVWRQLLDGPEMELKRPQQNDCI